MYLKRFILSFILKHRDLKQKKIEFKSISNMIDTNTPQGKFFFTIMAGFAEMEAELIRERTKAGLESARARIHLIHFLS